MSAGGADETPSVSIRAVADSASVKSNKLNLADQAVLKREQSEQEMAISSGDHDMAPIVNGRSGEGPSLRRRPRN